MNWCEQNHSKIFQASVVVCLLLQLAGQTPSSSLTLVILALVVICLGLPHGALDFRVAQRALSGRIWARKEVFSPLYLLVSLTYSVFWTARPTLGLLTFLLIAAYHFSDDWERQTPSLRLSFGSLVVFTPTLLHGAEVEPIYRFLLRGAESTWMLSLAQFLGTVSVAYAVRSVLRQKGRKRTLDRELWAILVGAVFLKPLLFFCCYFGLLHSPRHLLETCRFLGLNNFSTLLRITAPIVLTTLGLAALCWHWLPVSLGQGRYYVLIFQGLASLTVPHVILEKLVKATLPAEEIGQG